MAYKYQSVWDTVFALAAPFIASAPAALHIWTHSIGSDWRRRLFEHAEKRFDVYKDESGRKVLSYLASRQAKIVAESEFERAKMLHSLSGRLDRPYERVGVFITRDFAVHRAGAFTLTGNVNIGLPAFFSARNSDQADVDAFLRHFYPDFMFLETRNALLDEAILSRADMDRLHDALFLTERARTYVLFREFFYAQKWRLHFDALMSFSAIAVPSILAKAAGGRLRQLVGRRRHGGLLLLLANSVIFLGSVGVFGRFAQFYHRRADLRCDTDVLEHFGEKSKQTAQEAAAVQPQKQVQAPSQSVFASVFPKVATGSNQQQATVTSAPQSETAESQSGLLASIGNLSGKFNQQLQKNRAEAEQKWQRDAPPPKVAIDSQFDLKKSVTDYLAVSQDDMLAGAIEYYSKLATLEEFKTRFRRELRYEESLIEKFSRVVRQFLEASPELHLRTLARVKRDNVASDKN